MNKAKRKGDYWENKCAGILSRAYRKNGYEFKRVVGSGAYGKKHKHLEDDIYIIDTKTQKQVASSAIECKFRKSLLSKHFSGSSIISGFIKDLDNQVNDNHENATHQQVIKKYKWVLLIKNGEIDGEFIFVRDWMIRNESLPSFSYHIRMEKVDKYLCEKSRLSKLEPHTIALSKSFAKWKMYNYKGIDGVLFMKLRDFVRIEDGFRLFLSNDV